MTSLSPVPFALFEDNLGRPTRALLLHGHLHSIDCHDSTEADAFFAMIEHQVHAGRWVALVAQYELAAAFEPSVPAASNGSQAYLARALIFEHGLTLDEESLSNWWQARLATLAPQDRDAGLLYLSPHLDREAYVRKAERVLEYIRAGDCYQANLTFPMTGDYFGHPLALYARLREAQPVKHGALIFEGNEWLLSRSPELFFERTARRITCRPMKGTAPRSNAPDEDARAAKSLQNSPKNRAENLMIVDLIRNDLGRLAGAGNVHVRKLFELEPYETVFQLTSTVEADEIGAPLGNLFRALFPCGSVTGAPKVRAMQIIHELEERQRGPYCGAIGFIKPDGDCNFNVPIRTLRLSGKRKCRMDIGSGIVADSDPEEEYDECLTKSKFATDDGLQLIETLRCEIYSEGSKDEPFPLLAWHLQRLARSSNELRFKYNEDAIRQALLSYATTLSLGLQRVRLLLSRDGTIALSHGPLEALGENPTVGLAQDRLDADDLRLQHKTTARGFYDTALQDAMANGHFDVIYLNTRDEVCEGARSNIFIERAGQLFTPPVSSGLLPGVMRAQLLAAGSATETVISYEDLLNADSIFVTNALRGLVRVHLRSGTPAR